MDAFEHGPMASGAAHCHFTAQIDKVHIPITARSILDGKGPSMDELEVSHVHIRRVQKCWKAHFRSRTWAQLAQLWGSARISFFPKDSWAASAALDTQQRTREQGFGSISLCVCHQHCPPCASGEGPYPHRCAAPGGGERAEGAGAQVTQSSAPHGP